MAYGLMGGIGTGLSGFEEAFSRAQGRQDTLNYQQKERAMMQAQIDAQNADKARILQGQNATNAMIAGASQGGMMGIQAPPIGIASPQALAGSGKQFTAQQVYGMPEAQQQALFGKSFAGADMSKVLSAQQMLAPKATSANVKTIEMDGPSGYGTYAVNIDSPTSTPRFLGGGKPQVATQIDPAEKFKLERQLAKEWEGVASDFKTVDQQYNTIQESAAAKSKVGDIGLIFAIMKMFDPGSVVRESEFALAQNTESLLGMLQAQAESIQGKGKLTESQREEFTQLAGNLYKSTNDLYGRRLGEYKGAASSYGFDVDRTVADVKRGGYKKEEKKYDGAINRNTPLQTSTPQNATSAADALINKYRVQ